MKRSVGFLVLSLFFLFSCKEEDETRIIEIKKAIKEKELVFKALDKAWTFAPGTLTPESQSLAMNWTEWRLFTAELQQKPKGTIGAFQRKSTLLVQKADLLYTSIPSKLEKPQIRSRLMAIITKVKALHTFITLDRIPEKRVVDLITELNIEVNAFQAQIEEIVRRSHIQLEEGESEMLQNVGANPQTPIAPVSPEPIEAIQSTPVK